MRNYVYDDLNINKIYKYLFISLIPLIIFGVYRFGIFALVFDILGFGIGVLVNYLFNRKDNVITSDFYPFYGILCASLVSVKTNILIFGVILLILFVLNKKFIDGKVNLVSLCVLLIILISSFVSKDYPLLISSDSAYLDATDYFLGKGSGGINATCTLLVLISYVYLSFKSFYKREIPIAAYLTFGGLNLVYLIVTSNFDGFMSSFLANGICFIFVYVATLSNFSSYSKRGRILYGVLVGSITFALYFINPAFSALGAVFLTSLTHNYLDKLLK